MPVRQIIVLTMSNTSKQIESARTDTADQTAAVRLNEWRNRLDAFSDAFDAEVSQILTELAALSADAMPRVSRPAHPPADLPASSPSKQPVKQASNGDRTMEFTLPPAPAAALASAPRTSESRSTALLSADATSAPRQTMSAPAAGEPNRLAALKEKLSQQMASGGHAPPAASRSTEGSRS
jgi:hypothetical protein